MTIQPTGISGSTKTQTTTATDLWDRIRKHLSQETASFHTPGHKGRGPNIPLACDVTELPSLDELGNADGVLANLERDLARLWGSQKAFLSVNGASACLQAAMIALATRGNAILLPRNCHRSVIHGLVLSGLRPIWYEPQWDKDWGVYGAIDPSLIESAIASTTEGAKLAAVLVVSPTYTGTFSELSKIADICHRKAIPLITDAAHGAHFVPGLGGSLNFDANEVTEQFAQSDIVIHSLHKTLGALTQTGLLRVNRPVDLSALLDEDFADLLRKSLTVLQSSSPSYLLMQSIEHTAARPQQIDGLFKMCLALRYEIASLRNIKMYAPDPIANPTHIFLHSRFADADHIYRYLWDKGVSSEATIGNGVLLIVGIGTTPSDLEQLMEALRDLDHSIERLKAAGSGTDSANSTSNSAKVIDAPNPLMYEQVLPPREAFLSASELVAPDEALGRIAAECYAPCPPGYPLIVPGQRLNESVLASANISKVRVCRKT